MAASLLANNKSLPPGFRFFPTDEELFMYYLKRKVMGKSLRPQMISEVDVYRFDPWDLPSKSCMQTRDLNWFFFCPRSKKFASGSRTNRSTEHGYWKSTGNDRTVPYRDRPVGKIKTLIFHQGKAPRGDRTDWVMHEYRLEDKVLAEGGVQQDAYVICKVYQKSGVGPKNGEQYGAPFVEEEWESDDDDNDDNCYNNCNMVTDSEAVFQSEGCGVGENHNASVVTSSLQSPNVADASTPSTEQLIEITGALPSTQNGATDSTPYSAAQLPSAGIAPVVFTETGEDDLDRLLAMFGEDETPVDVSKEIPENDIFNGLEDLTDWSQFCGGFLELNDLQGKL